MLNITLVLNRTDLKVRDQKNQLDNTSIHYVNNLITIILQIGTDSSNDCSMKSFLENKTLEIEIIFVYLKTIKIMPFNMYCSG